MNIKHILFITLFLLVTSCGSSDKKDPLAQMPSIFGLGVSISDIALTHPDQPQLFVEFGAPLVNGEGGWKNNAHPEFFMPIGTAVTAVSEGTVIRVVEVEGPEDLLIMVRPDDAPQWTIGYEHVSNVVVSAGDRVAVGDVIAEIAPDDGPYLQGYGKTALMIFVDSGRAGENLTYCPFLLLDDSVRDQIYQEVDDHVTQWEQNIGRNIFDEELWYSTGCYLESLTV